MAWEMRLVLLCFLSVPTTATAAVWHRLAGGGRRRRATLATAAAATGHLSLAWKRNAGDDAHLVRGGAVEGRSRWISVLLVLLTEPVNDRAYAVYDGESLLLWLPDGSVA